MPRARTRDTHALPLRAIDVAALRWAVAEAEDELLFAPPLADAGAEQLRERAGTQCAELLATLAKLERALTAGPAPLDPFAGEAGGGWVRRGASRGVVRGG